jgi:hypothetical protein
MVSSVGSRRLVFWVSSCFACCLLLAGCGTAPEPVHRETHDRAGDIRDSAAEREAVDSAIGLTQRKFRSSVSRIDADLRARMRWSWHPGCPVPRKQLRYVTVSFVNFDGQPRQGELVVHKSVTADVITVMKRLYRRGFPIRRLRLIDDYRGSDPHSMRADNSSAFNCREAVGSPGEWSQHSYGRAIDLNPVENPYITSTGAVKPRNGRPYVDRTRHDPGMIHRHRFVVHAFATKDYQHFSQNGH